MHTNLACMLINMVRKHSEHGANAILRGGEKRVPNDIAIICITILINIHKYVLLYWLAPPYIRCLLMEDYSINVWKVSRTINVPLTYH